MAVPIDEHSRIKAPVGPRLHPAETRSANLLLVSGWLLLQPVTGSIDEVSAAHLRCRRSSAWSRMSRVLGRTPIALAADEQRRHVDRAALTVCRSAENLGAIP